ncbi:MAG TPA: 2-oxo-4-hydroxy-4-carboxy-5-ureidoimidazoline decarboxylase [Terriglobales bacterium]|nr:2-oxo-4-hydroxy-4-carboxy-5-ureidoimidazoline decarboxylase [Terriglobales bacterium]
MRSDPADFELIAPGTLQAVVALLADKPGQWLPIAGGTDVMVQYAAGKLPARKLISIWNLPELQGVETLPDEIRIGAGCTYTELREHNVIAEEFPLLASAARWTGGIANQNRGTLGGNIVNASPAADSLPALLAYEAELIVVSARGERQIPYLGFHTGYKKMNLAPDELIRAICLGRRFSNYLHYARKVGAREAQAIAKVCIAALGHLRDGVIEDVRIALGSVAPVPLRLPEVEQMLKGKTVGPELLHSARETAAAAIEPIDDIRSTAKYRAAVAGNLVAEFVEHLGAIARQREPGTSNTLARWNFLPATAAANEILPCCGSRAWADGIVARRPLPDEESLLAASDEIWRSLPESDWLEAFRSHPRIGESRIDESRVGESRAPKLAALQSATWSEQEQQGVADARDSAKIALAEGNREYERRFNRIFIVCATGKSPEAILKTLRRRLENDDHTELQEAAEEQRQITQIRLRKWLQG